MTAQVTIIVATYDRPDALETALAGVRAQTFTDWRCLVIGDQCGPETGRLLARHPDPRIDYVNLPVRYGEQAGPNSIGMALAETPFIAFLNHDDVWLPDHLERGLAALASQGADFHVARAAFAGAVEGHEDRLYVFAASEPKRRLYQAFDHEPVWFEPASAWILRREAAQRVGPWTSATRLYRPPISDWLLRAWRARLALSGETAITLIKTNLLGVPGGGGPAYARRFEDFARWRAMLADKPEALYAMIRKDLSAGETRPGGRFDPDSPSELTRSLARALNMAAKGRFLATGEDRADAVHEALGLQRGHALRHALRLRTGEALPEPPDLDALIAEARRQLETAHAARGRDPAGLAGAPPAGSPGSRAPLRLEREWGMAVRRRRAAPCQRRFFLHCGRAHGGAGRGL